MCHIFFRNPLVTPVMCLITTATQVGDFFFHFDVVVSKARNPLIVVCMGIQTVPFWGDFNERFSLELCYYNSGNN